MCGIVAVMPADPAVAHASLTAMRHRGPDSAGLIEEAGVSLGIARLAITDREHGDQPLRSRSGQTVAVFNGAIYNDRQLIENFALRPLSGNDGAVLVELYETHGLAFVDHLEGMFTVCLLDVTTGLLVVAVDPSGIKQAYIARTDAGWVVCSTVEAIPTTARANAFRVAPGTVWTSDGIVTAGRQRIRNGSLHHLLVRAVDDQIPREVPWACMLSGGLDSSLIAAIAARDRRCVRTYTAYVGTGPDVLAAREVARIIGADHREVVIDEQDILTTIDKVIAAIGSPDVYTVLGGIGTWAVAEAAAEDGIKVLLSGEGADEIFGGYGFYADLPEGMAEAWMRFDEDDLGARECLRLDRCTMAHSVEARVPYLDPSIVAHAHGLSLKSKIDRADGILRQKGALRTAGRQFLPAHIAERQKLPFPDGAGYLDTVGRMAASRIRERDLSALFDNPVAADFLRQAPDMQGHGLKTAAYFWCRWSLLRADLKGDYPGLVDRGVLRRSLRHGTYDTNRFAAHLNRYTEQSTR